MKSTHVDPHSTKVLDGRLSVVLVNYLYCHLLVLEGKFQKVGLATKDLENQVISGYEEYLV